MPRSSTRCIATCPPTGRRRTIATASSPSSSATSARSTGRILEGHLTGSAITVSADGSRVLLLHHRKLDRWLQPGGHGDPGETTGEEVALREALEESGIGGLALHPTAPRPLDVDVHDIPERGSEPAHEHLDLRYLVVAPEGAAVTPDLAELHEIRWVAWEEVDALGPDHGLRRALAKARAIVGG